MKEFDTVVGTSGGSIVLAALVLNMKPSEIINLFRISNKNRIETPKQDGNEINRDPCFLFMLHLADIQEQNEQTMRTVVLSNAQGKSIPEKFVGTLNSKVPGVNNDNIKKLIDIVDNRLDPLAIWKQIVSRMGKNGGLSNDFKSLIRMNVSSNNKDIDGIKGTVLILSKDPFHFYKVPNDYLELLLACVDQLSPIFQKYIDIYKTK